MKSQHFFSDIHEIELLMKNIEKFGIQYYKTGLLNEAKIEKYNSINDIPGLGISKNGDWNYDDQFLILSRETELGIRKVPQKRGDTKFAVDQMINPESAVIQFGGIYQNNVLVAGSLRSTTDNKLAKQIASSFSAYFKKNFKKIDDFYLSPSSLEKLNDNWRLVTNVNLDKGFDLKAKN